MCVKRESETETPVFMLLKKKLMVCKFVPDRLSWSADIVQPRSTVKTATIELKMCLGLELFLIEVYPHHSSHTLPFYRIPSTPVQFQNCPLTTNVFPHVTTLKLCCQHIRHQGENKRSVKQVVRLGHTRRITRIHHKHSYVIMFTTELGMLTYT